MRTIIEKQILEWQEELKSHKERLAQAKQVQTKNQAEKVLADTNQKILMIEGGIQAQEMLLKKIESTSQQLSKVEQDPKSKQKPSK